ncbi:MAG: hypothetical protein JWO98_3694 [Frankiales bacterium]|nr:hypothetical protein [Frankiales bacterium]
MTDKTWLACPGFKEDDVTCTHELQVSPEDKYSGFNEMYQHIRTEHADRNDRLAEKLMSRATRVTHA